MTIRELVDYLFLSFASPTCACGSTRSKAWCQGLCHSRLASAFPTCPALAERKDTRALFVAALSYFATLSLVEPRQLIPPRVSEPVLSVEPICCFGQVRWLHLPSGASELALAGFPL